MINLGLGIVAATLAHANLATEWRIASLGSDGADWFVDMDSLKDVTDGYSSKARKAWVKIDYSHVKSEPAREAKLLVFFKCDDEQAKITTWIKYKSDGSVLRDLTISYATYEPVVPETVLSGVMRIVCDDNPGGM